MGNFGVGVLKQFRTTCRVPNFFSSKITPPCYIGRKQIFASKLSQREWGIPDLYEYICTWSTVTQLTVIKRNVEFRGSQFSLFIDNRHIETDALGLILG